MPAAQVQQQQKQQQEQKSQWRQQAAEVQEPDLELPESPVPVLYDSDWEQQVGAALVLLVEPWLVPGLQHVLARCATLLSLSLD